MVTPRLSELVFGLNALNILYEVKLIKEQEGCMKPMKIFHSNEASQEKKVCLDEHEVIFSAKVDTDGSFCPTEVQFMIVDICGLASKLHKK